MSFTVGQRVRTTVDAPAAWDGAFSAPVGAVGTITSVAVPGFYGVVLDADPNQMPAAYNADELRPA